MIEKTASFVLPDLGNGKSVPELFASAQLDGEGLLPLQIYRLVRKFIVDLSLMPNRFISEKDVAAGLNISKTPVREAFIRLSEDGLVKVVPKSGTYVSPIDIGRAFEGYFIRCSLEMSCAARLAEMCRPEDIAALERELADQRAALNAEDYRRFYLLDTRFHEALFLAADLPNTKRFIDGVKFEVDRIRSMKMLFRIRRVEEVLAEHAAIVGAIIDRKPDDARNAAAKHFSGLNDSIQTLAKNEQFWSMFNNLHQAGKPRRRIR